MKDRKHGFISILGFSFLLIVLASGFFLRGVSGTNDNDQITQTTPAAKNLLGAKLEQTYAPEDFNGDGLMDVAVTDFLSDSVSVMAGDRAGYFHSVTRLSSGGGPRAMVAADFNRDGAVDLAAANFFSGDIAVFAGRGDGGFEQWHRVKLGEGLASLVGEDFNSDGSPDLAVANFLSGEVMILKGTGDGSFAAPALIGQVPGVTLILSRDSNEDGVKDLIAFDVSGGEARLFAGDGGGSFREAGNVDPMMAISQVPAEESCAIRKLSGDRQSAPAGAALSQPLVVEVGEQGESSRAGRQIIFSMLDGDAKLEAGYMRTTDERGQASLALSLGELPGNNLVAAADEGRVAVFGESSTFSYADFFAKIRAALTQSPSAQSGLRQQHALLDEAERRLSAGDEVGAIIKLRDSIELLTDGNGGRQSMNDPVDLARRLLNQVLLFGSALPSIPTEVINCGETKMNRLLATTVQVDTYTFSGFAGQTVVITSIGTSGGVDAVAELYGPSSSSTPIVSNSPGNRSTPSTRLPTDGTYTIRVYDWFHDETGTYDINLQFSNGGCRTPVLCGQPLGGLNLSSKAQVDAHRFTGNAGEAVVITSIGTSGGVDAVAELYDPSGNLVVSNSPGNRSTSSTALPVSGSYTILVYDWFHDETGNYDLNLQYSTGRCGAPISCGPTKINNNLSSKAQVDAHTFTGNAGEAVVITSIGTSGGVDAVAELYNSSGTLIGSNSPGNRSTSSIALPTSGSYTILLYDWFHDETGAYDLNLQFSTGRCGMAISCDGQAKSGNLSSKAQVDAYTFSGGVGCSVVITTRGTSGGVDAVAELYSPSGAFITSNSPGDRSTPSIPLTASGTYTILVYDWFHDETGTYDVSLSCAGSCPSPGFSASGRVAMANGTGISGVTMNFTRVSGTGTVPTSEVTGQNGNWSQTGFQSGTYRVTPVKTGCTFNPTSRDFSSANTGLNFTGTCTDGPCVTVSLPGALSGPANGSLMVPVTVPDLTGKGVVSYDFTLMFDPAVLQPQNPPVDTTGTLSNGRTVTTNTAVPGMITVSAFGTAPLSGSGTLLILKFTVIGRFPACTDLKWINFRFNEGTPCATPNNGRVCVSSPDVTISGMVSYCITPAKKVPGVVVKTNTTPPIMDTTDSMGNYALRVPSGSSVTVTPMKTGDVNGITSFDASLVAQCVVGLRQCTLCERLAGDASNDGNLTSFDASLIAQYVAGLPLNPVSIVGTWKFVPPSKTYTNVSGNLTGQDYDAVLVGDVSGNWTPPASILLSITSIQPGLESAAVQVPISLPNTSGAAGASVTIPITVGDLTGRGYVAYDFDITFNNAVLQPQNPPIDAAGTLSSAMNITPNATTPGRLRVSAFGTAALAGAGTLLNLKFNVVGAPGNSTDLTWQRFLFNEEAQTNLVNGRFTVSPPSGLPTVTTSAASSITNTSATLNGNVNPNGLATNIWFEWGTSSTLASFSTTPMQAVGSGTTSLAVSANLSGLTAGTTYYFRLAGASSAGTARGIISPPFTTLAPPNPIPVITNLSPNSANAGGLGFTLTVNGRDFVNGVVVRWNGSSRATTFVSSAQSTAAIAAADIATAGMASVTVTNPGPGGGASTALNFTINPRTNSAVTTVDAAGFRQTVAPESIAVAFGANLATQTTVARTLPLPTSLGGTSVYVNGIAAPLFFVSSSQVNYQIPPATTTGTATVTITSGDGTVSAGTIQVATVAPGLFAANANGQGVAAAIAAHIRADGSQNFEPVARFDQAQNRFVAVPIDLGPESDQVFLILFGTGVRFRSALSGVTVKVGGADMQASFAGATPGFVGLDQVNVRLLRSLIGRGEVDVALAVDGKAANTVKVNIR